jgi:two-component system, LytTR family, response regulator
MTVRCLIVEDEPLALERLRDYVQQLPVLQLVGAFDNATDALSFLLAHPVDLVFLDINLGGMSGIELLETSAVRSQVILTTAHPDFALKAYDLKVADYLLKPFTFARFAQAVERARTRLPAAEGTADRGYVFIKTEFRLERLRLADVLYIEGDGDYRQIQTLHKRLMTLETFAELEQRLPPDIICRVHKSYMVALDKIESVERDRITIRQQLIPISASYRDRFYALIGHGAR